MKTLLIIIFGLFNLLVFGQSNRYNDYFDLNLKGNPESILDISTLYFDKPIFHEKDSQIELVKDSIHSKEKYYFDSLGRINKVYRENIVDSLGEWISSKINLYNDSVVINESYASKDEKSKLKLFLDSEGFIIMKIIEFPIIDTLIFTRDSENRIAKSYHHLITPNSHGIDVTEHDYNENGDIKYEKITTTIYSMASSIPINNVTKVYEHKYVYDLYGNWIKRFSYQDNKLITKTKRIIEY